MHQPAPEGVRSLGPPRVPSPFLVRHGERAERFFRSEEHRILFDDRLPLGPDPQARSLALAGPRREIFFDPERTRAAIVTCGGLCPGLNDVVHGLVQGLVSRYRVQRVLGYRYGFDGLQTSAPPLELDVATVARVHEFGGSMLGNSRGKLDSAAVVERLRRDAIDLLFVIGGDGSMRGALSIANLLRERSLPIGVVGIPKTIDNDLQAIDRSFGFDTAFSTALHAVRCAHNEAWSAPRGVGLVKLMGRHSGFIACWATLASSQVNFCLIPEAPFTLGRGGGPGLLSALEQRLNERDHAVIVVAEGAGQEHFEDTALGTDPSGNRKLGDIGTFLTKEIVEWFDAQESPVVLKYIDPSYILRAVPANATDNVFCWRLAQFAVHAGMAGLTALVVGQRHGRFVHLPIETVVAERRQVDPSGDLWLSVLESTQQTGLS